MENYPFDFSKLDQYITLEQAADQLGIEPSEVWTLALAGKLAGAKMPDKSKAVSQKSVNALLPKEKQPEYQKFDSLKGVPIRIFEARIKYEVSSTTIVHWMQKGLIHQISKEGRKTFIDESDVAYCAAVYSNNKGQGKWVFEKDGKPYSKK